AAFADKASLDNERNALLLASGGRRLLVVQIAGALARRIVCHVGEGDRVRRGVRFGLIMFGSRVDLFLPPEIRPAVRKGDRVQAGTRIVGGLPAWASRPASTPSRRDAVGSPRSEKASTSFPACSRRRGSSRASTRSSPRSGTSSGWRRS